jgi:hypothetical protein
MNFELSQGAAESEGWTVANGTPVCRGRYRGVARVITRLADAPTIRQVNPANQGPMFKNFFVCNL